MALFFIFINKLLLFVRKVYTNTMHLQVVIKHILEFVRIISNGDCVSLYFTKTLGAVDIPSVREKFKPHCQHN